MSLLSIIAFFCFALCAHAIPRPVVLMHGMGDAGNSDGMDWVKKQIEEVVPGVFVHSITIGKNTYADRMSSFYDDLNRQVGEICAQLARIEELRDGFDAVGFSQGGQILRAYVQRCNDPPVRNLITVGAQHQGVSNFPGCPERIGDETGLIILHPDDKDNMLIQARFETEQDCSWWQRMMRRRVYSDWAQEHIVQAQYFKDPQRIEEYLSKSNFLADINNEREPRLPMYKENLASLENFVMFMFTEDIQVVPKETSWFGFYDGKGLIRLQDQAIYKEDWIGLRELDESGRLHFLSVPAPHMRLPQDFIKVSLGSWLGTDRLA